MKNVVSSSLKSRSWSMRRDVTERPRTMRSSSTTTTCQQAHGTQADQRETGGLGDAGGEGDVGGRQGAAVEDLVLDRQIPRELRSGQAGGKDVADVEVVGAAGVVG